MEHFRYQSKISKPSKLASSAGISHQFACKKSFARQSKGDACGGDFHFLNDYLQ
jgi:hypothetical protein